MYFRITGFFEGIIFREFGLSAFLRLLISHFGYIATAMIFDHMLIFLFLIFTNHEIREIIMMPLKNPVIRYSVV